MRPARVDVQPVELIASAGDGVVAFDPELRHTVWNPRMEELTGISSEAALGRGLLEVFPAPRHAEITSLLERALAGETVTSDDFVWSSSETVVERWLCAVFAPHRDSTGGIRGVVGVLRDVSARRMVAEASAPIAPEFRRLVEQSVVGMYVLQDGRYRYANPRLAATLGYTQAEILAFDSVASLVALDDHALVLSRVRQTLEGNEDGVPYTFHAIHKSGRPVEVEVLEAAIELDGRPAIVGTLTDVTERRRVEAQIVAQAYNDPLTKLPNRARLLDRLDVDLAQARRHGRKLAVVYLDIDFFKYVNDSWGHSLGDSLLQSLALRLKRSVREADTVARMGGDEFVILVPELRQSEDLASIAQKLLSLVGRPFSLEDRTIQIAASVGIASYPEDGADAEELLRNADAAMYRAKELGRNNFQLCTRELTERAAEQLDLQKGLRLALEQEEFVLHFQPITSIVTGRTVGFEALVRWQHPQKGMVGPTLFIPVAEQTGLILPLGDWVLRSACAELRRWHQNWLPSLRVAVNFSARQFRERNLASHGRAGARRIGPRAQAPRDRDHGVDRDGRRRDRRRESQRAPQHGGRNRDRRFRHGLLLDELPEALPRHVPQDRPLVRDRSARQSGRRRDRARDHRDGARLEPQRDRRGRRDEGSVPAAAAVRLQRDAGLLDQPAAGGRGHRRSPQGRNRALVAALAAGLRPLAPLARQKKRRA